GTVIAYLPSISVAVPVPEPSTDTVTPGMGSLLWSRTIPVMVISASCCLPTSTDGVVVMEDKEAGGESIVANRTSLIFWPWVSWFNEKSIPINAITLLTFHSKNGSFIVIFRVYLEDFVNN